MNVANAAERKFLRECCTAVFVHLLHVDVGYSVALRSAEIALHEKLLLAECACRAMRLCQSQKTNIRTLVVGDL